MEMQWAEDECLNVKKTIKAQKKRRKSNDGSRRR